MVDQDDFVSDSGQGDDMPDGGHDFLGEAAAQAAGSKDYVVLNGAVHIFFDRPLPEYDTGPVKAYYAKELGGNQANCYALVCDRSLMPRLRAADVYGRLAHPCLNSLIGRGAVYWPPQKKELYVFVYEGDIGKAFCQREESVALSLPPKLVTEVVLPPIVAALRDFKQRNFYHGGLRLSNMYPRYGGQKLEGVVIGDALATPYAYCQPVLYSTIPMAMADPAMRGLGTHSDEMYGLGVCLALMLRTHDPLAGKSDAQIISEKMQHGSYAAITGRDRFTGAILELLRGLLHDDATQRWTVEDVSNWMEGRRLSPKQNAKLRNAPRPIKFNGARYTQLAALAMDLPIAPLDAVRLYESEDIYHWIERSLEDRSTVERYKIATANLAQKSSNYQDKLVALMSMVLHPSAPIRYKGLRLLPESIGVAMAAAVERKQDLRPYIEIITSDLATTWFKVYDGGELDAAVHVPLIEKAKLYLSRNKICQGAERCIYHLWSSAPCLSPVLENFYVFDPRQILPAFNRIAKDGGAASRHFIDRHVAAFLQEKEPKLIEPFLFDLDSSEAYRMIMAELTCCAGLQARYKGGFYPHLALELASRLQPVYERYHDKEKRDKIKSKVDKAAARGDLGEMVKTINDTHALRMDQKAFFTSLAEYVALQKEYEENAVFLEDRKKFDENFGRDVSAIVSCVVATFLIFMIAISYFTG